MDLAPQYSSVLTGIVRSGVLGASISTAIAGALRQKVGFQFPHLFLKEQILHFFSFFFNEKVKKNDFDEHEYL